MEQVIQVVGALLILAGFAAAQFGLLRLDSRSYLVLNLVGSAILAWLAWEERQWGFLLLESGLGAGLALEPGPGRARAAGGRGALRSARPSGRSRMKGAMARAPSLPADAPAWRRHMHGDGYAYGWLLALIAALARLPARRVRTTELGAGDDDLPPGRSTLIAALRGLRRRAAGSSTLATVAVAITLASAAGVLIGSGELDLRRRRAPSASCSSSSRPRRSSLGIVRQARAAGAITRADDVRRPLRLPADRDGVRLRLRDHLRGRRRQLLRPDRGRRPRPTSSTSASSTMTTTGFGDLTALRPRPVAGDHRGADRPDLPGHRGRADRRQPRPRTQPPPGVTGADGGVTERAARRAEARERRARARRRLAALAAVAAVAVVAGAVIGAGSDDGDDSAGGSASPRPRPSARPRSPPTRAGSSARCSSCGWSDGDRRPAPAGPRGEIGGVILFPPEDADPRRSRDQIDALRRRPRPAMHRAPLVDDRPGGRRGEAPARTPCRPDARRPRSRAAGRRGRQRRGPRRPAGAGASSGSTSTSRPSSTCPTVRRRVHRLARIRQPTRARSRALGVAFGEGLRAEGVAATAKHFPGLGLGDREHRPRAEHDRRLARPSSTRGWSRSRPRSRPASSW